MNKANQTSSGLKRQLEVPVVSIPTSKNQPSTTAQQQKRYKPNTITSSNVISESSKKLTSTTVSNAKVKSNRPINNTKAPPPPLSSVPTRPPSTTIAATGGATNKQQPQPTSSSSSSCSVATELPQQPMPNIYDAMLGEISDLVSAAQEAQSCGRLKMASTYQLLVHARLVGLGKRFDRFLSSGQIIRKKKPQEEKETNSNNNDKNGNNTTTSKTNTSDKTNTGTTAINKIPKSSPGESIRTAQAALAKILPSEINLDYTMMEHLARAAMELHNRRTGRGMLHEKEMERKQNASVAATTASSMAMATATTPIKKNGIANSTASSSGVAWTSLEKQQCLQAAEMYGKDKVDLIAKRVGTRTEAEVKAHLKNIDGMKRVEKDVKEQSTPGIVSPAFSKKSGSVGGGDVSVTGESTPEKRKGRGKKEPPKAVLTVPNTTFDAKKMVFEPI